MKRELRYGANVEWFLNDIAAVEMSDIDSGEFEIYGEDEAGRETCAYIDITELAADAARLISELSDQLQAAEHLAELRGRQNLDTKQKLVAMGHENGMMAGLLNDICRYHEECSHDDQIHAIIPLEYVSAINDFVGRDVNGGNPCPLTDAFLDSVRADELEKFAGMLHLSANKEAAGYQDRAIDRRNIATHALTVAAQRRAGKKGV
ncbi:hypothetical protein F3I27_12675 [Pantoea sp. Bo_2]|uniref:hypothetical protein n=1 Tax=unclassified Pantoea TaxID=2630326 RepID=UPI001231DCB0|nr:MULTISPECIES: hypothetical protein [unclassified Pantoea]KAA5936430.1 hypothetical protein F3I57_22530 [Pantoea sp. VH_3]KAA5949706.1 hypothetical protein F3I56_17655 [Pantoea sp. VH_25]KAA5955432.1 hypothetical protein F3I55_12715 [Pantoea sp. VH_24]KAA5958947.1 hypothetical protein F3I53_13535 [Pantoea sp. VH_16]KAA5964145.1 hypothetical protein F3I54_13375 [Pantoea sp. VH_18]